MKDKSSYKFKKIISIFLIFMLAFSITPVAANLENVQAAMMDSTEQDTTTNTSKIKLNYKSLKIYKGKTKKLILKNATGKIKWKSSEKSVVKVNAKGVITAKKKGKAVVTATHEDRNYKCKVTVLEKKNKSGGSTNTESPKSATVYWTPSGKVYHRTKNCPTLSRSKTIYSGSISKSGKSRGCKVCY